MTRHICPDCGGSGEPANPEACDTSHCYRCGGFGRLDWAAQLEAAEAAQWGREQAQTLWAERGGYAAGLARPC